MADVSGNYRLGPDAGRVVVKTSRAGLAAKVGHDLELEVTRWSADITVPGDGRWRPGGGHDYRRA